MISDLHSHLPDNLLTVFQQHVNTHPEKTAFIFLLDGETEKEKITYKQLDEKARVVAQSLQERAQIGDRILLCYLPGLDFISAFLGVLYAGMIAVPAYPLRNNHHDLRLLAIIEDCDAKLILGTEASLALMQQQEKFSKFSYLYTNNLITSSSLNFKKVIIDVDSIAFLQYTSGSTGSPKGVMVSHRNLLHNEKAIQWGFGIAENKTLVSWMPVQHDLGLIGNVLQTLYSGAQTILLPPTIITEQPLKWLSAIAHYKAYFSSGPNFAYETCVNRIKEDELAQLDLSTWEFALSGAEPLRADTISNFMNKFSACGLPSTAFAGGYGLAESTLYVTCTRPDSGHKFIEVSAEKLAHGEVSKTILSEKDKHILVSSGVVYPEHDVILVDDSKNRCSDNQIGEIWIKSASVARGYWHKPEITAEIFQAYLENGQGPYLRTGDLGFLENNELFVTGRKKDLIILQGRNIYPQDIEAAVEASSSYLRSGCTAAFSVELNNQEQLVIVAEVERTARKVDFTPVFSAIRRAVIQKVEAVPYSIQLLAPARSLRTTSGKIQRRATKAAYESATLELITQDNLLNSFYHPGLNRDAMTEDIRHLLEKILAVESLDIQKTFSLLGGTSLDAVIFQQELQHYFGEYLDISPTIAFDYPTVQDLIIFLSDELTHKEDTMQNIVQSNPLDTHAPIAIIGMSCRFPGGANDPEAFWQILKEGIESISLIPDSRLNDNQVDAQDKENLSGPYGGLVEGIELFDASFFNISPREAESMDPQQRLLLETAWHALEDAGIDPSGLKNSDTGVFIGATTHDYGDLLVKDHIHNNYLATGNTASVLAGRLSYSLGLQGPALTLDTACSSSLVALHEACNSLHLGEIPLAIVGGVNALLSLDAFINLNKAGMLAPDGHCKVFAENADGYVRGEGCGVVILKLLKQAQADGDNILGVIKSAVVNQDGASSGLTVPNGVAQSKLMRHALRSAQLQAGDIDYLEAHGTGTKLGDPMETHAISEVYGQSHTSARPLNIGSVKANIGHLEAAAGMAGLLKVLVSLQHEALPPQLHINQLNSKINLQNIPGAISARLLPWCKSARPRRAAISSFGFSGTNAHVIIEEAPCQN